MPRKRFSVSTSKRREIIDITPQVEEIVRDSGVNEGIVCISAAHCTAAIYVNEYEGGLLRDTLRLIDEMTTRGDWEHDRIDDNAAAHLAASVIGSSVVLPVTGGRVELGTWQRVLLVELDGPRQRGVTVTVVADK